MARTGPDGVNAMSEMWSESRPSRRVRVWRGVPWFVEEDEAVGGSGGDGVAGGVEDEAVDAEEVVCFKVPRRG